MALSRYGGVTGTEKISEDFENINVAFNNVANENDVIKTSVTDHIDDNVRHITQAEHNKLSTVSTNAYTKVNGMDAENPTEELTIVGDVGIEVTQNPNDKSIHLTVTGESAPGPHALTHLSGGIDPIPVATETTSGLMSPEDKQILTDVNVQLADKVTKGELLINVKDFGAVSDGITDNTSAIQAALNSIASNNRAVVFIPRNTNYSLGSLVIPDNIVIKSESVGGSELLDRNVKNSKRSTAVISRVARFTGGTPGYVNAGLYVYDTVETGVESYEWGIVSELHNHSNSGQHVGIGIHSHQHGLGPTWGLSIVAWKDTDDTEAAGLVGMELGLVADGDDVNNMRIGIDLGAGPRTGSMPTFYAGVRIGCGNGSSADGQFKNGVLLHSKMEDAVKISTTGTRAININGTHTIGIDFAGRQTAGTAIRLKSGDSIALDSAGLVTMRWNASAGNIEFAYNNSVFGYISSAGPNHAL